MITKLQNGLASLEEAQQDLMEFLEYAVNKGVIDEYTYVKIKCDVRDLVLQLRKWKAQFVDNEIIERAKNKKGD